MNKKDKISNHNIEHNKNIEIKNNKKAETQKMKEELGAEDSTKYGEFVSSYFAWLSLEKQKENAKRLEKMGTNEERKEL